MHLDGAVFGEFVGTMVLVLLGNGVVGGVLLAGSKAENAGWISITTGWALAVFCGVATALALGDPDANLNPAVTVAQVLISGRPERLFTYIPAQMLGAFFGATLVWLFYLPHFAITEDQRRRSWPASQRGQRFAGRSTTPSARCWAPSSWCWWRRRSGRTGMRRTAWPAGLSPMLVGAVVWSIGLSLGATTGYAINPARDLGPRIAHALWPIAGKGPSDWGYSWVPIVGPVLGAALAAMVVKMSGM